MFPIPGSNGAASLSSSLPLPAGWAAYTDAKTSREYYHHAQTGNTVWTRPTPAPAPPPTFAQPPPTFAQPPPNFAQPPRTLAPGQASAPQAMVQNQAVVQNHNPPPVGTVQGHNPPPAWQHPIAQTPPVTPHSRNVQTTPHSAVPSFHPNQYNPSQGTAPQSVQQQGTLPNNGWVNPQQTNFNSPTFHQNNMNNFPPPTPPNNLSLNHNPQWRPNPMRPPPHHNRKPSHHNNNNSNRFYPQHKNNMAKRQFPSPHGNVNNFHPSKRPCFDQQPQWKKCSKCGGGKTYEFFSKRQWNIVDFKRMCRSCVDDAVIANETAMKAVQSTNATAPPANPSNPVVPVAGNAGGKACSSCNKVFPEESFSKRQWGTTGTARKCKGCVDATVAANEANMATAAARAKLATSVNLGEDTQGKSDPAPQGVIPPSPSVVDAPQGSQGSKVCSSCKECLPVESYSKRQWSTPVTARKCKSCVKKFLEQYPEMQKEAARAEKQKLYGGKEPQPARPVEEALKSPIENQISAVQGVVTPAPDAVVPEDSKGLADENSREDAANGTLGNENATALLKQCSKCSMGLSESSYLPTEWTKKDGEGRLCNFCVAPQGLAVDGNPLGEGGTKKPCSSCKVCLPMECFSKRQWSISVEERKCKKCVAKFLEEYPIMQREEAMAKKSRMYGEKGTLQEEGRQVDETLKPSQENQMPIDENHAGDGTQAADEDGESENAIQSIAIDIIVPNGSMIGQDHPEGTVGMSKAIVTDTMLEKKGTQPEQAGDETLKSSGESLILTEESRSGDGSEAVGMSDSDANATRSASQPEQAVVDEILKSSEENLMPVNENGTGGKSCAAGTSECDVSATMPGKQASQPEQAVVDDAPKSSEETLVLIDEQCSRDDSQAVGMAECGTNASMPRKQAAQPEQALVETLKPPEKKILSFLFTDENPSEDDPRDVGTLERDMDATSPGKQASQPEQAEADETLKPSEENLVLIDENYSGDVSRAVGGDGKVEPASQITITPPHATDHQGLTGDEAVGGTSKSNANATQSLGSPQPRTPEKSSGSSSPEVDK